MTDDEIERAMLGVWQDVPGAINFGIPKREPASPLPTLAVHVGYRYQSPVGGWEYGDHIPAGFDTQKWAHQKIYILQEQS